MDYENKEENLFEWIRGMYRNMDDADKREAERFFPELKESEDERIRKHIIEILNSLAPCHFDGNEKARCIAYLEKQKEQKPAEVNVKALLTADRLASAEMTGRLKERSEIIDNPEKYGLQKSAGGSSEKPNDHIEWSEKDKEMLSSIKQWLDEVEPQFIEEEQSWLDSLPERFILPPKQEWSEGEEKDIQEASDYLRDYANNYVQGGNSKLYIQSLADRIESLRPHPHWKPSEEQLEVDLFECPKTPIKDAIEVTSRMKYIDEELKPIAEFIMRYASWNLHKNEWNQPTIEVPLFRVLDALAQRGKPYCEG